MIQSIQSYIVNKIKGLAGINSASVFPFEEPTWSNFPAIAVTLGTGSGVFLTNQQNQRTFTFIIRIYQEIAKGNMGAAKAEQNLYQIADSIITAFDNDNKLGGTDVLTKPLSISCGWVQSQPIRVIEIKIETIIINNSIG